MFNGRQETSISILSLPLISKGNVSQRPSFYSLSLDADEEFLLGDEGEEGSLSIINMSLRVFSLLEWSDISHAKREELRQEKMGEKEYFNIKGSQTVARVK